MTELKKRSIAQAADWVFAFWWRNGLGKILSLLICLYCLVYAVRVENVALVGALGAVIGAIIPFYKWTQKVLDE